MTDPVRTTVFGGIAAVLIVLTLITTPRYKAPEEVSEQGSAFYPDFKDPLKAASLEVTEWDESASALKRFRVEEGADGMWVIPSHGNYPADAKERLAKTAGNVIDLLKDVVVSRNKNDHEKFGVADPEELNVAEKDARGKRVTLRDQAGNTLVDFIFGKKAQIGGNSMWYVRVPGKDPTYAIRSEVEISSKFEDWIETDLLKLSSSAIKKIVIDNYSIDEVNRNLVIKDRNTYFLAREKSADPWKLGEMKDDEEVNSDTVLEMTGTLDDLKIVGVRRISDQLRAGLRAGRLERPDQLTAILLQRKGYLFVPIRDEAGKLLEFKLLSNEGETGVHCDDGVVYTLRFGDILVGTGDDVTAGSDEEKKQDPEKKEGTKKGGSEHRYLFVSATFDPTLLGNPPSPPEVPKKKEEKKEEKKDGEQGKKDDEQEKYEAAKKEYETKKKEYDEKVEKGKKRVKELNDRFFDWYYVIDADSFKKLRRDRKDLVKKKEKPEEEKKDEKKEESKPDKKE